LYNLPAVIESPIVFIPEGEKDVETLRKYGYVGTCNYDGASQNTQKPKWKTDYNPFFDGKVVYILPDNDPPGRAHAANIFRNIHSLTRQCRIVELPGLKPGGDITDYFRNGGTVDTFNDICLNAPEGIPAGWEAGKEPSPERRLKFTCFQIFKRSDWTGFGRTVFQKVCCR
jgi:DNA primase